MKQNKSTNVAREVIKIEIDALKKLYSSLGNSFSQIIKAIVNNKQGKIIISGVGKSGIIAKKWVATMSSTGTPSFFLDASNASHGDMGQISRNDIVILISLSGQSNELKNIIQYVSRNRYIRLIGITSKKDSLLYKNADLKFLLPNVKEAGPGNFVPTSSTTVQVALGDAIAIACMKLKKFGKLDFKKFHPSGSLSIKLKTVGDLMMVNNKIPFVSENINMKSAISNINKKKLGVIILRNNTKQTTGILTDGDLKRLSNLNQNFIKLKVKNVMKKKPISVDRNMLAAQALSLMNMKKITSLCVHQKNKKRKTIGFIHIHNILDANII